MSSQEIVEYEDLKKLNQPFMTQLVDSAKNVLESGWYVLGKEVNRFEENFSTFNSSGYTIGVASGLDALILSLKALDLPPGSEVIVPSNTYIATILSILQVGLKPILVEPEIESYNIDPEKIVSSINERTKAIIIVHLYGRPCNMDAIMTVVNKYDLFLIEDCAQAHGAEYNGKKVGTFGIFGAFSFYPTKNLGAIGDAGAITTDNIQMFEKIKKLRNYGSSVKYYNELVGYNSRLDEIQAAFLNIKLEYLDKINEHKRNLASIYEKNLSDKFIKPLISDNKYKCVFHIYNIRYKNRTLLREYLLSQNIKTEIHYPVSPVKQYAMQGLLSGNFPISEEIHETTLSLPISFCHSEKDVYRVIEVLNNFAG
jgi:dTDP-4-amino-4,6-dideoxygalactose transaminase